MSTAIQPMYAWKDLRWKAIERRVFKLQKRIYQASNRGDRKLVHRLQRLLTASWSARLLAVRNVTQDNRGKRTAGIDGVKSLAPPQRLHLATTLRLTDKAKPVRRVWIPKPGSTEQRPLGIPTIDNRAQQTLAKLALEPEGEAHFEPNSYGFRPGRSCHDAVEAIYNSINKKAKYVLDADIAKCVRYRILILLCLTHNLERWLNLLCLSREFWFTRSFGDQGCGVPKAWVLE